MVEEFAMGMEIKLASKKIGETVYTLRLFPIGGFCKMLGEDGGENDSRAFCNKSVIRRIIVLAAGAVMNFILAIIIFFAINLFNGMTIPAVSSVMDGYPAQQAGLMQGDRIIKINNTKINIYDDFAFTLDDVKNTTFDLTVKRGSETVTLQGQTKYLEDEDRYILGFSPQRKAGILSEDTEKIGFFEAAAASFFQIIFWGKATFVLLGRVITTGFSLDAFTGSIGLVSTLGTVYTETSQISIWATVLSMSNFLAYISTNIGLFNLFPLPALDGGRLIFVFIEGIFKKKIDSSKEGIVHFVGMVLLLALAAVVAGAVLVVDASQGVEAQTLANVYLAIDSSLSVVPVINKIDLTGAVPDMAKKEIEDVIGLDASDAPLISAKNDINIEEVFKKIITDIPAPEGDENAPLKALIFDSVYDAYKGVIVFVRVIDGKLKKGDHVLFMATGKDFEVVETGFSIGQIYTGGCNKCRRGDTVTEFENPTASAFPGYKKVNPMVYCAIFPADGSRYEDLRDALEKLKLNDASLQFEPENSVALGFGFRCGFLGLLHLEIIQERLDREYNLDLVTTAPSVIYKIYLTDGQMLELTNPNDLPDITKVERMEEPWVKAEIILPTEHIGRIMELCQERRGEYVGMEYIEQTRAILRYDLPLNEIIYDFFDALKSRSRGYASFDYELSGYRESDLVKLDILVNREIVDALSFIVHSTMAYERGQDELISEIKKRNQEFFEILINEYTKPIYYLSYNILKNTCRKEDIEECVSDVILEVWLKINDFNSKKGSFKTWVFMLTKYKALKYKQKAIKNAVINIDDYEIESTEAIEKTIIEREKQIEIIKTIDSFNSIDKELFIRRYFYGEEINNIMESLNLSRSAVDNRLLRGRKRIKEALAYE
ncbi:translation factor guf1-related [Holotrichia oblita]|nr:translation factor guf1-related [Holotrichia oblita]